MNTEKQSFRLDRLALILSLGGVLLGIAVAMIGSMFNHNFTMHGYGVFSAFSVAAIVLGAITRTSAFGKTAMITYSILLVGSLSIVT